MSDGGWYGYPPEEPDPYAQPQDDALRSAPEYGNAPQSPGYDAYGQPTHAHPQYNSYYEQQQQQGQQYRQPPRQPQRPQPQQLPQQSPQQAQNPYFQQQQQQRQQEYGYDTGYPGQQAQSQHQPQQYSTGQQPTAGYEGYEGYAQPGYDTGGYPSQNYESPGYDTATGYPTQGYDSAASYDTAAYGSGAYDTGARSGGYAATTPGHGQAQQQNPANPYAADPYAAERADRDPRGQRDRRDTRDPYADLGGLAEESDEYEYPSRAAAGRRRRAESTGQQPQVTEEGRFGLLESEEETASPSLPGRDDEDDGEGGGRKRGRSGGKQRDKKNAKRSCLVIFLFFALIAGGLGYGSYQAYKYYEAHYGPPADYSSSTGISATAIITIPSGSGGDEIGSILFGKGVIASERAFVNACNSNSQCGNIQADTYQLHKQMSASAAVTALLNTANVYNKSQLLVRPGERASAVFTDLEQKTGWTQAQIVAAVNGGQIDLPSYAAAKPGTKYPFADIEGMLFTGTYQLPSYKTPTALLKAMVDQQVSMFNAIGLTQKASSVNMTPYQVLTVASMARAEAGSNPADLSKIAGVIYTRLKSSEFDKLGFDTATLYGLGRTEPQPTAQELADSSNPYNLRVKAGLPPGPIDSVDQTALMAALAPTDSTDVFFCAVNGTVHYASSNSAWAALGRQFPGYCG
jgi:UPF0755 protein